MNCDQAFERLTDDEAANDAELALHLRDCPRCRAMQLTLSPVMEWLREDHATAFPSGNEWRDSSSTLLTEESVAVAMEIAQRLPKTGSHMVMRRALGLALMMTFGIALGVFVFGERQRPAPEVDARVTPPTTVVCLWTQRDGETALRSAASVVDSCIACHVPAVIRN